MKLIKAPEPYIVNTMKEFTVFLAGSIEGDTAEHWQDIVQKSLEDLDIVIFNPRRDEWDSSWEQKIENPKFKEQVEWELNMLERCDLILMYFDPNTKSPISLLELGLFAGMNKMLVCCPDGFWRKGNVDIVCERYGMDQTKDLDGLIEATKILYRLTSKL